MRWTGGRVAVAGGCALLVGAAAVGGGLVLAGRDPAAGAGPAPTLSASPTPSPLLAPTPVLAAPVPGPPQTAAGTAAALAGPLSDDRLGPRVSAVVVDADSGRVLLDRGSGNYVTPASTAKLATSVALLAVTEPDQRLSTTVVAGTKPGEVVLVGGGDVTLSGAPAGKPTAYEGAARIATLAAAARKAGAGTVTRVVVDSSLFPGPAMAPSWDPRDVTGGYITPISPVMVDAGTQEGLRARSSAPDLQAGRALAAALGAPKAAVVRGKAPAGAATLATVRSQPIPRLVEHMLLASDNVLAEALARQVAIAEGKPAGFTGAAAATRTVLGRLGLPAGGDRLLDGSGLSLQDRVTPALLAGLLRVAAGPDDPRLHALVPGLPVSGYLGTLDDRYRTGPAALAAGEVRAKTGTLDGVSSLAGLVRGAGGRLLAFAVVADRVPSGGTLAAEAALDDVAAALARCTCR
ncbi:MAG TPA: D-alanyl-D-alanine carboxypeptidase/D-alanyl-D-alanine-endopeptidase [Mycobacteriales bacterium]|nr:D-alanyl-D-alanine carboxypeptidase/D-alanyl-D-alanine-endopeptidase [Mycobacteriales bacterium]